MIKTYFFLTKPGIIFGNLIAAIAGFFLASKGHVNFPLFAAMILGLSFVIGSACVFNNYIDRDIDKKMERTKNRALVRKTVPVRNALIFATLLGIAGFFILVVYVNFLTGAVAFVGFFFYVVVYSIGKRRSAYGTELGSIAGAVPPVVGYCTVAQRIDGAALLLFFILVFWQMPHFYAIAIFRLEEYAAAKIPVLPVKKGIRRTKQSMLLYIVAFIIAACLLTVLHFTGYVYLTVAVVLGCFWFFMCVKGFQTTDNRKWGRKMFGISLMVLLALCVLIAIDIVVPVS